MEQPDLLLVCISAMLGVFVLLGFLALTMRGLMAVFPERPASDDAAVLAAVAAVASAAYPGTTITNITEQR